MLEMTAELATPDSLDSLDRSEGEEEQGEKGMERTGQEAEEREEENSLLNEEEKDKSSPTIQLASGAQLQVGGGGGGGGGSPDSSQQIAVSRDVVVSHCSPRPVSRPRCVSVCGPRPLRVSVVCSIIISVWVLLVFIMHLDKKVTMTTSQPQVFT